MRGFACEELSHHFSNFKVKHEVKIDVLMLSKSGSAGIAELSTNVNVQIIFFVQSNLRLYFISG